MSACLLACPITSKTFCSLCSSGRGIPFHHCGMSSALRGLPTAPVLRSPGKLTFFSPPTSYQDLLLVRAPFTPACVHALGHQLVIKAGRMMMGAPSDGIQGEREFGVRDFAGVRIISE